MDVKALLSQVDIVALIDRHVPLKKAGADFEACCPFHTENSPSFKVSPSKQFYHCFGCGANGDAIKFLQEFSGLSFLDAVAELGGDVPRKESGAAPDPAPPAAAAPAPRSSPAADREALWRPIMPVPDDAPEPPKAHLARRFPESVWAYKDAHGRTLGYITRYTKSDGKKHIMPLTWCEHRTTGEFAWRWISFSKPRPLYGLDRLADRPQATVLLVEGEKCADAAAAELADLVCVSWPGGCGAIGKVDWSPLAGRKVILWADCDAKRAILAPKSRPAGATAEEIAALQEAQPILPEEEQPGVLAMAGIASVLLQLVCRVWRVRIPAPGEQPDGWDVADAISEGLAGEALAEWVRQRLEPIGADAPPEEPPPPDADAAPGGVELVDHEDPIAWRKLLLRKGEEGSLIDCRENIYLYLKHHPTWRGVIWADEFSRRIIKRAPAPWDTAASFEAGQEWKPDDDLRLGMWLAQSCRLLIRSAETIDMSVGWAARESKFHPVKDYLEGLQWDGTPRCDSWLSDYLGVRPTPYAAVSGRYALIGMVSRIYKPGALLRSMPILEGPQFRGKSSALRILGAPWFADTAIDLANKDAYQTIQGIWVYEISEMDAYNRADSARMKGFISSTSDRFRAPYDRRPDDHKRQTAFFGTINPQGEYFKDATGNTRYWPWQCEEIEPINLDGLAHARDQLLAEAVMRYHAGDRWHPDRDEQESLFREQQEAREMTDAWYPLIDGWLRTITSERISVNDILLDCLKIERGKIDSGKTMSTRVGQAMAKIGWLKRRSSSGAREYFYLRPKGWGEEEAVKAPRRAERDEQKGAHDAPF